VLAVLGLAAQWALRDRIGRRHLQAVPAGAAERAA
jgi:hypothetical protein